MGEPRHAPSARMAAYVTHGSPLHTIDKSAQLVMVDVVVHRPLDIPFCRLLQLQQCQKIPSDGDVGCKLCLLLRDY